MPNHVFNLINASEKVIKALLDQDGDVDFSKIIPRPKDFDLSEESIPDLEKDQIFHIAQHIAQIAKEQKKRTHEEIKELTLDILNAENKTDNFLDKQEKKFILKNIDSFVVQVFFYLKTKRATILDWNRENWGTKGNAYESDVEGETVSFKTAWSHPLPVIQSLSLKFPNEEIEVFYADENLGYNFGSYTIENGVIDSEELPEEGTKEAIEWSADFLGWELDYEDEEDDEDRK